MKRSVFVLMLGTLAIQGMGNGLNTSGQACTPPSVSQISTTDLKTHYEFKGNSNDVSGYNNTGLPLNGMALAADRFSVPNSAYVLNGSGSNQWMATTNSFTDPNIFTIGIWFKTTSTSGGGIMGFCDNQTSTSLISRDRVIYMNDLGQLRFGLYTGTVQTIKTNESYNDGYWHFAVASLSPDGMKLYVDGLLKAVDPSITAGQSMTGYWRLGHFNLSEGWSTASSHYFNGTLDEVYYYERELSASEIKTLYEMPYGAGSDSPKCSGETLSLKGATVSGATYSWTGPNGFTSTAQNPFVSNMSSVKEGLYYLTITDAASCSTTPIPVLVRMPTVSVNISQVPTTGLITRYVFNGNSTDVSGNANTGAFQNSPSLIPDRFGNAGSAYLFNGSTQYVSTATSYINPTVFSLGLWFKTTSTAGGKLMGFGNSQTGASSSSDRHIYMTDGGQLVFGVNSGAIKTISTNGEIYNDGKWHFVIATLSGAGIKLYVDGNLQSSDPSVTSAQNYTGYWKVGYDEIQSTWPSAPSGNFFNGSLDDVYLYNTELSAAQITTLYKNADGAGSNEPFCSTGGTLELTAPTFSTATHSYYWTGPNGFTSISQNPSISGITISNAGLYTLTVTTTSSCPAKAYTLVRIDDPPAAPVTTGASRCGAGSVVLNASGSPLKYRWYTASSGGTSLAGTSSYTTPNLTGDVTYHVSSVNSAGCESSTRTSVTARINSIPSAPTGVNGARCEPGTVTLAATGSPSDYNWYAASIGGTLLGTGSSYAPSVSATTTFYVSSVSVEGCESSTRTAVIATINTLPSAPTTSGAARCGTGTVTLTASGSPSEYNWYAASSGGISLGTGSSYAPTVSAPTTTFYVSSVSAAGCESPTRTAVIAIVNPLPSAPTATGAARCSTGIVTLTASGSPSTYNWYAASSGGISLGTGSNYAPTVSAPTTTFYVSSVSAAGCESSTRTAVIATVNPLPSAPTTSGAARCSTGTVTLTASGSPSAYNWYAASSGGISLGTGSSYAPTVSAPTTTFYVSSVSAAGCESSTRTAVIATVNALPSAPTATGATRCSTGTVTLTASGSPSDYNWYAASSGGISLGTGSSYAPTVSGTTTFYVSSVSAAGCESSTRTAVVATVNTLPTAPITTGAARCSTGVVTLIASGSPSTYNWYAASSGGISLGTGSSYAPTVSATTTFHVSSVSAAGCESSTRTAVIATVNALPSSPTATGAARCSTGTVTLIASGSPFNYNWYAASIGGVSLGTGSSYAPTVSGTTTYYVSSVSAAGCESSTRTAVVATVNALPAAPTATGDARCGTGAVTLTASGSPSGYSWYAASSGGASLATGSSFSPIVSADTIFYVSAVSAEACESATRTAVNAIVHTVPSAPIGIGDSRCGPGIVKLSVTGFPDYKWYSASVGGSSIGTGSSLSPTVSADSIFYVSALSAEGCESAARTEIIATVHSIPIAPTGTGDSRCGPGIVVLTASGSPSNYNWYAVSSGGLSIGTGSSFSPTVSTDSIFYVSAISVAGCESSRVGVSVIASPLNDAATLSGSAVVCSGVNSGWLQLSNYSGVIQKWEVSLDDFAFDVNDLSNTSDQYEYHNIFETSYYRVIVKSGVCPLDTFDVTVTVDLPTDAGWLSGGGIIESPDYTGSLFLMEHTGTIIRWESSTDDFATFSIINNTSNEHFYSNLNATTSYRVLVKSGVCSEALSNIVTLELPVKLVADTIQTTRSISYHPGISVLSNDYVSSSYLLQSALPAATEMGGTLTMDTLGYFIYKPPMDFFGIDQYMYSVCDRATGTHCFTAPLVFNVKDTVIVYSSLTPNGDNMNDVWVIDGINSFPGNSVKILNRWGDIVYQQDNYNNQDKVWKGQCNSGIVLGASILPDGTYFYSIELGNGSGSITGYVVIKQ